MSETRTYLECPVDNKIVVDGINCVKGENIALDCYFTSLLVAEWKYHDIETVHSNKKRHTKRNESSDKRWSTSTKWCYHGKKVLISYANETGPKIVLALETMYDVTSMCAQFLAPIKGDSYLYLREKLSSKLQSKCKVYGNFVSRWYEGHYYFTSERCEPNQPIK